MLIERVLKITILLTALHWNTSAQEIYLFAYFKSDGKDGLHFAWSDDGLKWTALKNDSSFLRPDTGADKLMRDPCVVRGPDSLFHMVWTTSWNERGIGYSNSADLIHWSPQRYLPVMADERGARNCWSPEIFYDAKRNEYMIFWSTTIDGQFSESASQKENGYNHRIYYVITKDFKSFSNTELLYDMGFNVIDATIISANSQYVMFVKDETAEPPQKNIRMTTSAQLTGGYSFVSPPITGNYWAGGPAVLKTDKGYYLYFDKYVEKKMGAMFTKDLKTWTDISQRVKFPVGVRHGSVLTINRKILGALLSE